MTLMVKRRKSLNRRKEQPPAAVILLGILAEKKLRHIGESSILKYSNGYTNASIYICRSQTLSKEFEAYLAKHGLEPEEGVKFVDSSFEEANNSTTEEQGNVLDASYSEEVRRLLRGSSDLMSTSMKVRLLIKMPEDYFFLFR